MIEQLEKMVSASQEEVLDDTHLTIPNPQRLQRDIERVIRTNVKEVERWRGV